MVPGNRRGSLSMQLESHHRHRDTRPRLVAAVALTVFAKQLFNAPKAFEPRRSAAPLHGSAANLSALLAVVATLAGRRVRDTVAPRAATEPQRTP